MNELLPIIGRILIITIIIMIIPVLLWTILSIVYTMNKPPNTACTPFSLHSTGRAAGRWGLPSAHALGLGDPVKLDERCSLHRRFISPIWAIQSSWTNGVRLRLTRPICGTYGKHFAHAWLRVFPAPKQSPRPPQRHASRTQTVRRLKTTLQKSKVL